MKLRWLFAQNVSIAPEENVIWTITTKINMKKLFLVHVSTVVDHLKDWTSTLKEICVILRTSLSDTCEKTFTMKESLKKHINVVHLQIKNKCCVYCDYKTHTKFNLDLHINKMHLGVHTEKQNCSHCGKTTYKLDHHMKVYHGELVCWFYHCPENTMLYNYS